MLTLRSWIFPCLRCSRKLNYIIEVRLELLFALNFQIFHIFCLYLLPQKPLSYHLVCKRG